MKKEILYNTAAQLTAKFVSMSLTVLATILITRAFGKEGYGQFSLMQTLPALFFILVDFGLNTTSLKKIESNKETAQIQYGTVLSTRLLLSLVFATILNIIVIFLPYSPFLKTGILLSSLLIFTQGLYASTNLLFQFRRRYDLSSVGYISGSVFTIGLILVFLKLGLDVRVLSFAYVFGGLLTFIVSSRLLKKLGYSTTVHLDKTVAKSILAGSLPLGLMFIFSQINFKADSIMLSFLSLPKHLGLTNIESVAIYSLPYKVFEVALVLPTFFMNAVYPIFVKKMAESKESFIGFFRKTIGYVFGLGIISSIFIYVTAPVIVRVLGGTSFDQSISVLRILSFGLLIFFITQPISYFIVTLDRQKYLPAIYLISAVFNVTANLILIPKFGLYASAYITWISELLILTMLVFTAVKSWRENR